MIKKIISFAVALLAVLTLTVVSAVAAELPENKQALIDMCRQMSGDGYSASPALINRMTNFLQKMGSDDITDEQLDAVLDVIDAAEEMLDMRDTDNVRDYISDNIQEIAGVIQDAAEVFDYTAEYDVMTGDIILYDKDGKKAEKISASTVVAVFDDTGFEYDTRICVVICGMLALSLAFAVAAIIINRDRGEHNA